MPLTLTAPPPRPPYPPRRVATGAPEPEPRDPRHRHYQEQRERAEAIYAMAEQEPASPLPWADESLQPMPESAPPPLRALPSPAVPASPPSIAPTDIGQGVADLPSMSTPWDNPWVKRAGIGLAGLLGARFVAAPIAGMFLTKDQEAAIASLPLGQMLTGYSPLNHEERRRELLGRYV